MWRTIDGYGVFVPGGLIRDQCPKRKLEYTRLRNALQLALIEAMTFGGLEDLLQGHRHGIKGAGTYIRASTRWKHLKKMSPEIRVLSTFLPIRRDSDHPRHPFHGFLIQAKVVYLLSVSLWEGLRRPIRRHLSPVLTHASVKKRYLRWWWPWT